MGAKILVADDSITIQKVVELTFSKEDFQIFTVNNGEDAIKKAKEVHPDLLLVDVIMPQKNGYEVCEALRADPSFRDVPILLLAGTFETFDENEGRRVGANDFVTKPFESQILVAKVKQLLEESKSRPPAVAAAAPPPGREPAVFLETPAVAAKTKEEALPPMEAEPAFHLPPELMMEEPTIPPPFKEDSARELKKMGFWEPPKSATPPAVPKEPTPIFLEELTEPKEIKAKEEIIYELEAEEIPPSSKMGLPEEKLWEMADLGKTEIIELPVTPPPTAAASVPPSELPPLDLSGLTSVQPSVEQMAQELGMDMAPKAPPAEEFKMEELIPQAPPSVSPPESIKIAPSKGGELPPEIVSFETLGDAAAMEIETEEASISPRPSEKVEPISLKVKPSTPPFVPIVEEKPPVKTAVPLEVPLAAAAAMPIKGEVMEELVQRVVKEMAEKILEKVAWEVIPDMAEILIIKEIERIKAKAQEESRS